MEEAAFEMKRKLAENSLIAAKEQVDISINSMTFLTFIDLH